MVLSPVARNVAANFGGKACAALLTLLLVPVYIRYIGVEAYGLVGLYATLMALIYVMDMGLSTTLNRELARLSARDGSAREARDLVRTFELPFWIGAIAFGAAVALLAPVLARHWVNPRNIAVSSVQEALLTMGIAVGLQFPSALYSGGLMGLQRQILLNAILIAVGVLRGAGAVAVLHFVSPTIEAFLRWQIAMAVLQTAAIGAALWIRLPPAEGRARFRKTLALAQWRFAGGVGAATLLGLALTQMDKLILSAMLPLEEFGYYTLAGVAASALTLVTGPVFQAVFPRLCQLAAASDREGIRRLYHTSSQVMAVLILPPAMVLVLFPQEVMTLWTGNPATVDRTRLIVALLAAGTALHGLVHIPSALQLAHGWTRLGVVTNLVAIVLLVPAIVILSAKWGGPGAALVWPTLTAGYVGVSVWIMHRRLMPGETVRWYLRDTLLPLIGAGTAAGLIRWLTPAGAPLPMQILAVSGAGILSFGGALAAAPDVRRWLLALRRKSPPLVPAP